MNTGDSIIATQAQIVEKGSNIIDWLMHGPEMWAETKRPFLAPDNIGSAVQIGMMAPSTMHQAWIQSQEVVAHTAVSLMVAELVEWAKENRPDFFLTVGELVEEAVRASDAT